MSTETNRTGEYSLHCHFAKPQSALHHINRQLTNGFRAVSSIITIIYNDFSKFLNKLITPFVSHMPSYMARYGR